MLMKINLNLNKARIKSNKSNAFHSIFSFSISPIFTKKTGFSPTFGEFQSFNKTFISFCGIKKKKKATKIVVLSVVSFIVLRKGHFMIHIQRRCIPKLNCLRHSVPMKGPKFGAALCKQLYINIDNSLVAIYCSLLFKIVTYRTKGPIFGPCVTSISF